MALDNITLDTTDILEIPLQEKSILSVLVEPIIILFLLWLISQSFISALWVKYTNICHTTVELTGVFIALATFFIIWYTYKLNNPINNLIGFGFLIIAVFQTLHIFCSLDLSLSPLDKRLQFSISYLMLNKVILIVILSAASFRLFNLKFSKWMGLLCSILIVFVSIYCVFLFPQMFSLALFKNSKISLTNILSYALIAISFICAYKLRNDLNNRDILTYRYLFLALVTTILSELFFIIYDNINSLANILSHLLKMISYFYLFQGIFVSSVTYPYEKLEQTGQYIADIVRYLPIGLITYSSNLKASFSNEKAKELLAEKNIKMQDLPITGILEEGRTVKDKILSAVNSEGIEIKLKFDIFRLKNKGFLVLFNDAKKEQELENLQLQTKTILDSINSMVLIFDNNYNIIACNKAFEETLELGTDNVIGLNINHLRKILNFNQRKVLKDSSREGSVSVIYESSITTLKDKRKELIVQAAPIINVDGENIGGVIIASDVTTLKEEQEKFQQREKLASLGQMAAGIVHEIRNPLASIKGFCQLIESNTQQEKVKRYAQIIEDEVKELNRVVTDFLNFAKPRRPVLKEIFLNQLVDSMRLLLESHCFMKGVEIEFIFSPNNKLVMVDESQIKQVILNIVENAIDSLEQVKNPSIIIKTSLNSLMDEGVITISDNGKGMSEEERLKVGTPFFTTKDKGTGLGLSICYQIIKEHGGRITIQSQLDLGTSFSIYLPIV